MIIKDGEGKDVEVFTPEEVKAKVEEATKPLQVDLEKHKVDLAAALAAGGTDKDENIKKMREAIDLKNKEITELANKVTNLPSQIKAESLKEAQAEIILGLAGKDEDLKKKIEFYMGEFKTQPTNQKELKESLERAYVLATGGQKPKPGVFDNGAINAGAGYGGSNNNNNGGDYLQNESANAKAMRGAFGISDEDAKKFGKV